MKPDRSQMKPLFMVILLVTLSACGKQPIVLPTETSIPTVVSTTPVPTSTLIPVTITPSPPEQTIAVFTPEQEILISVIESYFDIRYLTLNSLQLPDFGDLVSDEPDAKAFLDAEMRKLALEIKYAELNRSRYVGYKYFLNFSNFAMDASNQLATVSLVEDSDIISENSAAGNPANPLVAQFWGLKHTIVLRKEQGQWRIVSDHYGDFLWRTMRRNGKSPDELFRTLMKAVSSPPQSAMGAITPEPAQLERWAEYENALARILMPMSSPEKVLCEWELLGQTDQEVYVWAFCMETTPVAEISPFFFRAANAPAVIHIGADGAVQNVEIPEYGPNYLSDIRKMFPLDALKRVADTSRMRQHLYLRRERPQEPPLIVLDATPTP
jgi:hypothetical protein